MSVEFDPTSTTYYSVPLSGDLQPPRPSAGEITTTPPYEQVPTPPGFEEQPVHPANFDKPQPIMQTGSPLGNIIDRLV